MSASPRLRAPHEDGAVFALPPLADVAPVLAANRRLNHAEIDLLGRPLAEIRDQARAEAVAAARAYLQEAGEPVPAFSTHSLLLAGHQPELFHPGVWVKHFALSGLARAHGATPLNLVVDNDTAKTTAVRIPLQVNGDAAAVRLGSVPFDHWAGEVPYEERRVHDEALFADFADRAGSAMRRWNLDPLLPDLWAEARGQAERTALLGERLASARRSLERRWGCHNLEVPVSHLCRTDSFARFACHLLAHLPRFHTIYNEVVRSYRREHGIRSRNHPVPKLAADGDWLEAPLWAWRAGQARRHRLLVRRQTDYLELHVGGESWPALSLRGGYQNLEQSGFKIRSRALTTTLFARLFLADLFIHGIGGAKYDELTDKIIRHFYGLEPPGFMVLSATRLLPLPDFPVPPDQCRHLARLVRDLHYNPDRHLPDGVSAGPGAAALVANKRDWIARHPADHTGRKERFHVLRDINDRLRAYLGDQEQQARGRQARCEEQVQANAVLRRRDYAFCLYPESVLRPFCTPFLHLS